MDVELLLQTLLQMYGMMLLGFIMAKTGILDDHVNRKLSTMVVAVVYPLMLLYSMTGQEGDTWEAVAMLAVGFAVYIGMILAAKVFTRLLRVPEQKRLEFECLLVFGNTGFIGAPLAQSLYGNAAFFQMTLLNFAYYFFYNTYAVSTLSASEGKRRSFSWRALFTPGFVMTLLAIVLYFLRFDPPAPVGQLFQTVGNMTTPLSMIILGSSLAMYPIRDSISDLWSYLYCLVKLLLMPAAFYLVWALVGADRYMGDLMALSVAMPAGSMVLMLALQTGHDSAFIGRSIFVSTLLSAVTLPVVAALFLYG